MSDLDVLRRNKVLVPHTGRDVTSLGGLLAIGRMPQEHFPQLMLTFVYYPTVSGAEMSTGLRYLDSVVAEGPIPIMVHEALRALRRNMKRRAVVHGAGREAVPSKARPDCVDGFGSCRSRA
ncbi:hypothetical protein [Nocardia sp. NPDC052566]|uniref:hypothetical protein n=1 Tax=Nocardia sp. NPDC052566 TaxID=3364330 RepID=UPI0037C86ABA